MFAMIGDRALTQEEAEAYVAYLVLKTLRIHSVNSANEDIFRTWTNRIVSSLYGRLPTEQEVQRIKNILGGPT